MPKQNTTTLRPVRSPKQWEKFDQQVNSIVRQLVNGEDENAKSLVLLAGLIETEQGIDQVNLLWKIRRAAFLNSCDFDEVFESWEREVRDVRSETPEQVRRRA